MRWRVRALMLSCRWHGAIDGQSSIHHRAAAVVMAAPPRSVLTKRARRSSSPRSTRRAGRRPPNPPARGLRIPAATPISCTATSANGQASKPPSRKPSRNLAACTSFTTMPEALRHRTLRSPTCQKMNSGVRSSSMSSARSCARRSASRTSSRRAARSSTCRRSSPCGRCRGRIRPTAAKGAVAALTRSMAVESAPHKITFNAIARPRPANPHRRHGGPCGVGRIRDYHRSDFIGR